MEFATLNRAYRAVRSRLTRLFLFIVFCCVAFNVLIWFFGLFDDLNTRILVSVLIALVPLGFQPSPGTWEPNEQILWLISFLALAVLLLLSDKFNWPVVTGNAVMSVVALPYGWMVWKLMRRNRLLLTGLVLVLAVMMIYWMAALIGQDLSLSLLLLPLPVVLSGGVIWTPVALWTLNNARRRKCQRLGGPGMQALAMAVLFLPAIVVAATVPGILRLESAWSAVSLTIVGVLLSAVVADPLRRFLLEWGNLAPNSHDTRAQSQNASAEERRTNRLTMKEEQPKHICHECIGDQFLASEVKTKYPPAVCHYCGGTREAIALENLAQRTHDELQEHFELTPDYPSEPYEHLEASQGRWERRGETAKYIVAEMAGLDEEAAGDVTALLSDQYGGQSVIREGGEDPYGDDAMYEARGPNDLGFRYTWEKFRREVRSRSRFFSTETEEMLGYIFGDLRTHKATDDQPVVREINPGDPDASVWRARTALSAEELETILKSPSSELSSPPSRLAKPGRMNAQGISVFYGAMDHRTCVSEVRAPVGAHVVVGKFDLLRTVRLLDLDALSDVYAGGSYFDPEYSEKEGRAEFFRHLVSEISRPVMPQDEALEYIPTQAVAEYLAHKAAPRIDGIIFHSSQTGGDDRNVVLFNHARGVEPQGFPEGTSVEVLLPNSGLDDSEDLYGGILVVETVPSNPPERESPTGRVEREVGPIRILMDGESEELDEEGAPTLQLKTKSLKVLVMKGVAYTTKRLSVSRHRQTEEERSAFNQHSVID